MPTFADRMQDYERQIRLVISPDVFFVITDYDYGHQFQAVAHNLVDGVHYSFLYRRRAPDRAREQAVQLLNWLRYHQLTMSDAGQFEWETD